MRTIFYKVVNLPVVLVAAVVAMVPFVVIVLVVVIVPTGKNIMQSNLKIGNGLIRNKLVLRNLLQITM